MRPPTYFRLMADDRDRYLRERDNLARLLRALLAGYNPVKTGDKPNDIIREAREALAALDAAPAAKTGA